MPDLVERGPTDILLIEDNPDDALLLEVTLADVGGAAFDLTHAETLSEGLRELAGGTHDVVLLDLSLPDSHGLDTFARAHAQSPGTPIIVLTGLDDEEVAVQAVQGGAQDYLSKNQLDGQLLVRSLRYAIERQNLVAELVRQSRRASEGERRPEAVQRRAGAVRLRGLARPAGAAAHGVQLR